MSGAGGRRHTVHCLHRGRLYPVVVQVDAEGEYPQRVVCEDCRAAISSQIVWWAAYDEGEDGWYSPDKEKGPRTALLASPSDPSAPPTPLPTTP